MKWITFLAFVPSMVWASRIPVELFDQSKLEALLRNIPSAFVKNETHSGFVRKHYTFPKSKRATFQIKCQADYFNEATIPSFKACDVQVNSSELAGDESVIKVTDSATVKALREAISYGNDVKKFYSTERVYGQASDGNYKQLFRYYFICQKTSCDLTFVAKESNL